MHRLEKAARARHPGCNRRCELNLLINRHVVTLESDLMCNIVFLKLTFDLSVNNAHIDRISSCLSPTKALRARTKGKRRYAA